MTFTGNTQTFQSKQQFYVVHQRQSWKQTGILWRHISLLSFLNSIMLCDKILTALVFLSRNVHPNLFQRHIFITHLHTSIILCILPFLISIVQYCRLWLINACAYSGRWKSSMRLTKAVHLLKCSHAHKWSGTWLIDFKHASYNRRRSLGVNEEGGHWWLQF